jgi:hypothetical protein
MAATGFDLPFSLVLVCAMTYENKGKVMNFVVMSLGAKSVLAN